MPLLWQIPTIIIAGIIIIIIIIINIIIIIMTSITVRNPMQSWDVHEMDWNNETRPTCSNNDQQSCWLCRLNKTNQIIGAIEIVLSFLGLMQVPSNIPVESPYISYIKLKLFLFNNELNLSSIRWVLERCLKALWKLAMGLEGNHDNHMNGSSQAPSHQETQ